MLRHETQRGPHKQEPRREENYSHLPIGQQGMQPMQEQMRPGRPKTPQYESSRSCERPSDG